jgi:3',5'-cyclic AMP phosphodiesterase CpdA
MTPVRIVQVSDTHLSATHAYFAVNWDAFRAEMAAAPPELVVHGGDLSFNGPAAEGDLAHGAAAMAALGLPWRAIPGNHDIGEAPPFSRLDQPVNAERMAAWRRHVGPQWWLHDVGGWRLVGLDTALMASGLPEEAGQRAFLAEALAARGGRPVMVFTHMPPFDHDPEDPAPSTSVIPHPARGAFLDACASGGVRIIACGHLHTYRRMHHRGMEIVWAPATAMVDVQRGLARWQRFPRPGYVEWWLEPGRAEHRLVEPARMFVIDMSAWTSRNNGTTTTLPAWSRSP